MAYRVTLPVEVVVIIIDYDVEHKDVISSTPLLRQFPTFFPVSVS
jgi:hypothetical protein